jgi:hypothetical protein
VEEQIIGEEFLFASGQRISKEEALMDLGMIGLSAYDDIKPYYDRIDELIGIFGTNEGLENDPDGIFYRLLNHVYMNFLLNGQPNKPR